MSSMSAIQHDHQQYARESKEPMSMLSEDDVDMVDR